MGFNFKFKGKIYNNGAEIDAYKINKTDVCVSFGDYSMESGKKLDSEREALWISFKLKPGQENPPQFEVDYILKHFGLDVSKHYYTWRQKGQIDPNLILLYYEQIHEKE